MKSYFWLHSRKLYSLGHYAGHTQVCMQRDTHPYLLICAAHSTPVRGSHPDGAVPPQPEGIPQTLRFDREKCVLARKRESTTQAC